MMGTPRLCGSPHSSLFAMKLFPSRSLVALALMLLTPLVQAAPAPWYYWRSLVDGQRVCAQTSPGPGWEQYSAAYEGPGCQPRTKVIVVPMR